MLCGSSLIDTVSWNHIVATGDIPSGTDGHSACVIDNAMYLFGGFVDPVSIYRSSRCCSMIMIHLSGGGGSGNKNTL